MSDAKKEEDAKVKVSRASDRSTGWVWHFAGTGTRMESD